MHPYIIMSTCARFVLSDETGWILHLRICVNEGRGPSAQLFCFPVRNTGVYKSLIPSQCKWERPTWSRHIRYNTRYFFYFLSISQTFKLSQVSAPVQLWELGFLPCSQQPPTSLCPQLTSSRQTKKHLPEAGYLGLNFLSLWNLKTWSPPVALTITRVS